MFYAASEIIFWIFLAAIVGGGIGYGLSQAKSVKLNQRLTQSNADAPMERELAIAWDTIEDLNKRLQVAHETIRGSVADLIDDGLEPEDSEEEGDAGDKGTVNLFVADAAEPKPRTASNGTVGSRLSERVASASAAAAAAEDAEAPAAPKAKAK